MKRLMAFLVATGAVLALVSQCGLPQWAQNAVTAATKTVDDAKASVGTTLTEVKPDGKSAADAAAKTAEVVAPAPEATPAAAAPNAPVTAPDSAVAAVVSGVTSYFGLGEPADGKPWAAAATMNPDYTVAEAPPAAAPAPVAEPVAAPAAEAMPAPVSGVTSYYGLGEPSMGKPWAAEAAMNPDYAVADAAPAVEAAAPEEPMAAPVSGVTSFYGMGEPSTGKPWAAEATMNPDYSAAAAAPSPAAAEAPVAVAEEAPAAPTVPGVTSFYGLGEPSTGKPWAAEATMNPDYSASAPVATAAADPSPAAQSSIESCRDALNGEAKAGSLRFAVNKYDILPSSYGTLDKIAKIAKDCTGLKIEVGGHTDNSGSDATNQTISELRAKAVVRYLAKAGVDAGTLSAVGYGESKPVAPNDTPRGRRENRRTEFLVTQ